MHIKYWCMNLCLDIFFFFIHPAHTDWYAWSWSTQETFDNISALGFFVAACNTPWPKSNVSNMKRTRSNGELQTKWKWPTAQQGEVSEITANFSFVDDKTWAIFDVCLLFLGCLPPQQHVLCISGRICSGNFTRAEIEVADQTCYLTQSQHTDTGPAKTSTDPTTPGVWQDLGVTGMTRPGLDPYTLCSWGERLNH